MDLSNVDMTFFVLSAVLLSLICVGHAFSFIIGGRVGGVLRFAVLFAHLCLFAALMAAHVSLEVVALSFMLSLSVYCISAFLRYRFDRARTPMLCSDGENGECMEIGENSEIGNGKIGEGER